jgi:copper transport protein
VTPRVPRPPARAAVAAALLALAALLVGLAAGAVLTPPAFAHAALTRSVPAADSSVSTPPKAIVLTFSESVDPKLSRVLVVDSAARVIPGVGPVRAVPGKSTELIVPVSRSLPTGVYTVNWRSVSSDDGHVEDGAFAFGVGAVPGPGSIVTISLLATSPWLDAVSGAGRWLIYVGLALLIGCASTVWLAFGARLPAGGLLVLRVAVLLAAVGVVALIGAERSMVGAPSLLPLFLTREGEYLLALGIAVIACGAAVVAADLYPGRAAIAALGLTAVVAVLAHVLAGHAAAPGALRPLNILEQWIHMTAIGIWAGGLAWLLLGIRKMEPGGRAGTIRVFSRIATWTLVVVVATGVLRAVTEVGSPSNLLHTSYGVTLLVKVVLVLVVVAFAAFNHFRYVPGLDREGDAGRHVRNDSRAELVVLAGVLVATAVLTGLAPANTAVAAPADYGFQAVAAGDDSARSVHVTLTATPGRVGRNAFVARVTDYATGKTRKSVSGVTLGFALPSEPGVNASTLKLKRAADGAWAGSGLELSIVGDWSVTVLIAQPSGGVDVQLKLRVHK